MDALIGGGGWWSSFVKREREVGKLYDFVHMPLVGWGKSVQPGYATPVFDSAMQTMDSWAVVWHPEASGQDVINSKESAEEYLRTTMKRKAREARLKRKKVA